MFMTLSTLYSDDGPRLFFPEKLKILCENFLQVVDSVTPIDTPEHVLLIDGYMPTLDAANISDYCAQ
jgi:hypothetical protein